MQTITWNRATPAGMTDPDHVKTLVDLLEKASSFTNELGQKFKCDTLMTSPECLALLEAVGTSEDIRTCLDPKMWCLYNSRWFVSTDAKAKNEILIGAGSSDPRFFARVKLENFI